MGFALLLPCQLVFIFQLLLQKWSETCSETRLHIRIHVQPSGLDLLHMLDIRMVQRHDRRLHLHPVLRQADQLLDLHGRRLGWNFTSSVFNNN